MTLLDAAIASLPASTQFEYEIIDIIHNDDHMALYGLLIPVIYNPSTLKTLNWPFSQEMIVDFLQASEESPQ